MPFYMRTCGKCHRVFPSGDKSDLCAQCDPVKIRGTCTRCSKQIMMNEDYAHASDSSFCHQYVCEPCWKKQPHYIDIKKT